MTRKHHAGKRQTKKLLKKIDFTELAIIPIGCLVRTKYQYEWAEMVIRLLEIKCLAADYIYRIPRQPYGYVKNGRAR